MARFSNREQKPQLQRSLTTWLIAIGPQDNETPFLELTTSYLNHWSMVVLRGMWQKTSQMTRRIIHGLGTTFWCATYYFRCRPSQPGDRAITSWDGTWDCAIPDSGSRDQALAHVYK